MLLLEKGCRRVGDACVMLGVMHQQRGSQPSLKRAADLFATACNRGSNEACIRWAGMIEDGTSSEATGVARELYGNACIRKDPRGCYELGRMLRDGVGGPVDLEKAWFSFYQSCELMGLPDACGPLGELSLSVLSPKDRQRIPKLKGTSK